MSQLVRYSDPNRYVYTENGSKTGAVVLWQMHVENKIVPIIPVM